MSRFSLGTLKTRHGHQAAILVDSKYYPLADVSSDFFRLSTKSLFDDWSRYLPKLQEVADLIVSGALEDPSIGIPDTEATLDTPIVYPNKLIAVGANYACHLREMGLSPKKWNPMPFFVSPGSTTLVGPGQTVEIPKMTKAFDWELELAVIIGARVKDATEEQAAEAIAGYSIGLDLSCRDLIPVSNGLHVDLARGKYQDCMNPCGPVVVPAKFVPDVSDLKLTLDVNGKQMMNSSTSNMISSCVEIVSTISEFMTLEPGDVIFTGSPSGSAEANGGCWLKPGDKIHAEIEGIGAFDVQMKEGRSCKNGDTLITDRHERMDY